MSAILDAPSSVESFEVSTLPSTPSPLQEAPLGFWRRLVQSVTGSHPGHRSHTSRYSYLPCRQLETHQELLARQYPTIYILALSGV